MENKVGYLVEEKIDKDFTGYGTHTKERHFPKGNDDGTDGVNTRTYKGEYKNGKEHGIGMYSWSTGPKCVGEFVDDKVSLTEELPGIPPRTWKSWYIWPPVPPKLDSNNSASFTGPSYIVLADKFACEVWVLVVA